jgi:hypothetical protein
VGEGIKGLNNCFVVKSAFIDFENFIFQVEFSIFISQKHQFNTIGALNIILLQNFGFLSCFNLSRIALQKELSPSLTIRLSTTQAEAISTKLTTCKLL